MSRTASIAHTAERDISAALIERCAKGDRQALRYLYEAEAARMTGVARRILKRQDLAEEAVQDCFVTVWRKAGSFDPGLGSGRAWLYTVLRHRALNILRDGGREDLGIELDETEAEPLWQEAYDRLDEGSRLKRCLAALDGAKRRAVLMSFVVGYSHGEIAGRLAVPLGTVKAWINRGLTALRACLA